MSKDERLVGGFLVFIGITALVLGFIQTRQGIAGGILASKKNLTSSATEEVALLDEATLKTLDTDNDGLNDFDELNTYRTSAYLADSDSDGLPDGKEVREGTDPNCPKGKPCKEPADIRASAPEVLGSLGTDAAAGANSAFLKSLGAKFQDGGTPSAADIRTLLTQSGSIAPDLLIQFSDQELLAAWGNTLGKSEIRNPNDQNLKIQSGVPSATDMRAFLKSQGMSDDLLAKITDEQLLSVFQESLKKAQP